MSIEYGKVQEIKKSYIKNLSIPNDRWPSGIQRVVHCIHEHLFDPKLSVQGLKEKCLINGNNFSGKFKYYVGLSPQQYIIKYRIAAACRLLQVLPVDYSILHVALAVGFSSHSAFSRTFKRRKGITPSEFRGQS